MATSIDTLARHIVRMLHAATDGRPQAWRSLAGISSVPATETAVVHAVRQGWLLLERGHSICLTDAGRRLVEGDIE